MKNSKLKLKDKQFYEIDPKKTQKENTKLLL